MPSEFNLKINADSSGLIRNVGKAVSSIAGLEGASAKTTRGMGKAFSVLATIASAGLGLDTIQRYGDMLVDTTNRLALLTNSTEEANATMEALFETSKLTRTGFEGTAIVYSRVALALRDANVPMAEMIQFTSTLNKAIILSGTKSVEAGQALIQLSQGMASGALRGDELRSVMEQLPYVADLIADKMGVFRASLRNLGREGKITTTIVRDAIQEATEGVDKAFKKTTVSVSQAGNYLETSFLQSFKKLNEAIPLVKMLSGSLILLADNAGVLGRAIYVMTLALTAMNIYKILVVPIVAATSSIKALGASLHLINIEASANQFGTIGAAIYTSIIAPFAKASKVTAMYGKALDGVKGKLANNAEAIVAAGKTKVLAKRAMEDAGSVIVSKGNAAQIAPQLRDQYTEMLKRKSILPDKIESREIVFDLVGPASEEAVVQLAKWKEELAEAEHILPIITKQLNDANVMTATYTDRLAKNTGAINTSTKAYNDAVKAEEDLIAGKAKLEKKIDQTNKKMNESKKSGGPMLLLWTGIKKGIKSVIGALASFASRIGVLASFGLAGGAVATTIGAVVIVITALVALVFILSSKFKLMSLTMEDGTTKTVSLLDGFIALAKTVWKSFALFKGLSGAITWIKEGFTSLTNNTELWTFYLKTMVNMIMSLVFSFNTLYYSIKVAGLTLIGFFKRDFSGAERAVLDLTGSVDDLKSVLSGDFSKNFLKDLAKEIEKGALETNIDNLTKTMSELRNEVDKVFNVETSFLDKEELELYEFKKTLADLLPKGGLSLEGIIDPKAVELVIADMVKMGVGNDIVYGTLRRLAKQGTVTGKALVDGSAEATFENKKLADSFKEIDAAIKGLNLDPIQDLIDKYKAYTSVKLGLTHGKEFKSPSIGEWLGKMVSDESLKGLNESQSLVKSATEAAYDLHAPIEEIVTPLNAAKKALNDLFQDEYTLDAFEQLKDFSKDSAVAQVMAKVSEGIYSMEDALAVFTQAGGPAQNEIIALANKLREVAEVSERIDFFKGIVDSVSPLEEVSKVLEAINSGMARTASGQEKLNNAYSEAVLSRAEELEVDKTLQYNLLERLKLSEKTSREQESYSLAKEEQDRLNEASIKNIIGLEGGLLDAEINILRANKDQTRELTAQADVTLLLIERQEKLTQLKEQANSAKYVERDLKDAISVYNSELAQLNPSSSGANILRKEIQAMEYDLFAVANATNPVKLGLRDIYEQTRLTSDAVAGQLVGAFGHAEDAMVDFFMTGKLGFKEMINSMIADLVRFATQKFIVNAIVGGIGNFGSSSIKSNEASMTAGSLEPLASGGITSGGLTMVGERGPEIAAFPKNTRIMSYMDSMNAFGAASYSGNGAASPINITVNQNIESSGGGDAGDQDMLDKISAHTQKAIKESIRTELREQQRPRNMLNPGLTM